MFNKSCKALILYCCLLAKTIVAVTPNEISKLQCDCGWAKERTSKIIGGAEAAPYEYPWVVAIYSGFLFHCGGALITRRYVLTAAHCLIKAIPLYVGIAVHDLTNPGLWIPASEKIIHPNFNGEAPFYDVGLIKLAKAAVLSKGVCTLCLPHNMGYERPGMYAIAAGWGFTRPKQEVGSKGSRFLKEINMEIKNANDLIIKAVGVNGVGVCYGDSGSPLFTRYADGRYHVIGVTSRGLDDCLGPSSYPRIYVFNQWIMSNIVDSEPCEMGSYQLTPNETNHL